MARKRTNLSRMNRKAVAASRRGHYSGERCKCGCPFLAYRDGLSLECYRKSQQNTRERA